MMSQLNQNQYQVTPVTDTDYHNKVFLSRILLNKVLIERVLIAKVLLLPSLLASGGATFISMLFILLSLLFNTVQAATDTGLQGDDRYAGRFPIGFTFQYYNQPYNHFYASTNGLLQFSHPTVAYNSQCLPAEFNNTLYVFWDDMQTAVDGQPAGKIEYQTRGEAPNRQLIVQWTNLYFFGNNLPMGRFQAILYEGSNQIKYQYRNLLDERSYGSNATIGMQGSASQFAQVSCEQTSALKSGQTITFTPNTDGSSYVVEVTADDEFIDISDLPLNLAVPQITSPVNGSKISESQITIKGKSSPNVTIELTLNDRVLETTLTSDNNGNFTTTLALEDCQDNCIYRLSAKAINESVTSAASTVVKFSYQPAMTQIMFSNPAEGAVLTTATEIAVTTADNATVVKLDIYDGEQLLTSLMEQPYHFIWQITAADNGNHLIKAVAQDSNGNRYQAQRQVTVDVQPITPAPTAYIGKLATITPTLSYGQPLVITGQAIDRETSALMANVPLQLVLINNGFKRTIAISSDDTGHFSYRFIPQSGDKGEYQVAVIHPAQPDTVPQGEFTLKRISFNIDGYRLTAARNIPATINLNANANLGAQGLYWTLRAEDQPNGQLPSGITVISGNLVNLPANVTTATSLTLIANDNAAEQGTLVVTAMATESADVVRGKLQINYRLTQAQPALYTTPNFMETGVAQGESLTEVLTLANRGLVTANQVELALLDDEGNTAPAWIFLTSNTFANVNLGDALPINLTVQPDSQISDGIYHFNLRIRAENQSDLLVPVMVSVVQNGTGKLRFDVADIYTATLDANGQPIMGVAGATIKLQNEAVLSQQYTLTTDEQGIATSDLLPPGIYLYRASAANHQASSGRVRIRAGVTSNQHIFLDYELINIEFNVTESTIKDVYDIELEVTYNTQVPAPIVLLEPLAINLYGLQEGEEKTGQITLTNYGLVKAENLKFKLPQSDDRFDYQFFAELPDELAAKSRVVIPYKVTAKKTPFFSRAPLTSKTLTRLSMTRDTSAPEEPSDPAEKSCSRYTNDYEAEHEYECPNGDRSKGKSKGQYYELTGPDCDPKNWQETPDDDEDSEKDTSPQPTPMAQSCTPNCESGCCTDGGKGG